MDHETFVEEIIEAFEDEPEYDFPTERENRWARAQGVRSRLLTLLEEFEESGVPIESDLAQADDEVFELKMRNDALLDENEKLRQRVAELEEAAK
jgi:hypothetical protein